MRRALVPSLLAVTLAACGDPAPAPTRTPPSAATPAAATPAAAATTDHGASLALGTLTLAGHELAVTRLGALEPGKEGAFEASLLRGPAGARVESLAVYAWVEDTAGQPASPPSKGTVEGGRLHFHAAVRADAKDLRRVVLRLRTGTVDERASLPLDGHGHEHGPTPHGGVVAALRGPDGAPVGHVELKLHDDKGDLELWVGKDAAIREPLLLPLDTKVAVTFVDHGNRTVELRVRDAERNPDEDGTANVRDGRTHYFIFPGATGADATWLQGAKFQSIVRIGFQADGKAYASEELMLVPHTHADGSHHR